MRSHPRLEYESLQPYLSSDAVEKDQTCARGSAASNYLHDSLSATRTKVQKVTAFIGDSAGITRALTFSRLPG